MKIVINRCYGGFGLSARAIEYMAHRGCIEALYNRKEKDGVYYTINDIPRNDLLLVEVVERLGEEANNKYSELDIVEIPDDVNWEIEEYDGKEWVSEVHRTW